MTIAVLQRLGQMIFVMFGISALVFLIFFATPVLTPPPGLPAATPRRKPSRRSARNSVSTDPFRCNMA